MKTVKNITYDINEIQEMGYGVENNIITDIDINIMGHFGNIPCLTILCQNICPYGTYNDIERLGFLLKAIVEFFGLDREDGVKISQLKNIPCRIVYEGKEDNHWGGKAVGIGHFMKDRFILFKDFNELVPKQEDNKQK